MEIGDSRSLKAEINVTPLVDVMLVMLIIFILVTPLLQKGMGVTLPEARNVAAVSENEDQIVVVALTAEGQLYVGKDPVDKARLEALLRSRVQGNSAVQLQIKADRNARFRDIRNLIKVSRDAGFSSAALVADEIKDDGGAADLAPDAAGTPGR
ncbi:MAG TPA: biopolymer transporter ExbD [Candidatus Krumholzibacteria bacterium]|nr:biopolymer transporter ExbD [Candidatus Krumholzibacteria bacterium]